MVSTLYMTNVVAARHRLPAASADSRTHLHASSHTERSTRD